MIWTGTPTERLVASLSIGAVLPGQPTLLACVVVHSRLQECFLHTTGRPSHTFVHAHFDASVLCVCLQWHVQQQMVVEYLPKGYTHCVAATYTIHAPTKVYGYQVQVHNHAVRTNGCMWPGCMWPHVLDTLGRCGDLGDLGRPFFRSQRRGSYQQLQPAFMVCRVGAQTPYDLDTSSFTHNRDPHTHTPAAVGFEYHYARKAELSACRCPQTTWESWSYLGTGEGGLITSQSVSSTPHCQYFLAAPTGKCSWGAAQWAQGHLRESGQQNSGQTRSSAMFPTFPAEWSVLDRGL